MCRLYANCHLTLSLLETSWIADTDKEGVIWCLKSHLTSQASVPLCLPGPCNSLWLEERAGQATGGPDHFQQSFYGLRESKVCWSCYPYAEDRGKENSLVGRDCHEGLSQETGPRGAGWGLFRMWVEWAWWLLGHLIVSNRDFCSLSSGPLHLFSKYWSVREPTFKGCYRIQWVNNVCVKPLT